VRALTTAAHTIFPLGQRKKSAEDQIPYSAAALRQDLLRVRNAWRIAKRAGIAMRSMAISAPCSTL
jgi:hypothetical protein